MPRNSEFHAYGFIKDNLKQLGFIVKNPNRSPDGQVYTQQECLDNPRIAERLVRNHPEYIVKLNETDLYVIEAKPQKEQIEEALIQAEDRYANPINQSTHIKAKVISGVAGNPQRWICHKKQIPRKQYV